MADDTEEEEEESGGGKKKIFMAVGAVAVLGAVYQFVLKSPPEEDAAAMEEPEEIELVEGEIFQMEEMILNLSGEGNGFLRIGVAVVLEEGTMAADFEADAAIAKDVAVQYLSSLSSDDLATPEGRQAAKDELGTRMREAYDDEKVVRVLFTALVMQ